MRELPTVADLQRLSEGLMLQLRLLLPFYGKWERPSVHRVLGLLYRTLPLAQLGSTICKLILEKLHEQAKREVEQSSNRNSAEYALQRWRETKNLTRALSMPADHSIPPSWLLGKYEKPLKSVVFHQLAPQKRYTAATLNTWCPRTALHAVSATTEEFWRSHAPNAAVKFWRKARHPERALTIREGATVSISSRAEISARLSGSSSVGGEAVHFVRVQTIWTIDGDVYLACLAWREPETEPSVLGQPVVVRCDPAAGVTLVRAERVRRMAFVLPCGNKDVTICKRSGFNFKGG